MRSALIALFLVGCSQPPPPAKPEAHADPAPAPPMVEAGVAETPSPVVEAGAPEAAAPPPPPPVRVQRSGTTWPYHAWDRAEAYAFNQFEMKPRVPLVVYNDTIGWSPFVAEKKPLDEKKAKQAFDLAVATQGDVEVSKCAFPRHAVVLFDKDVPVASINVCFSCGDILVWPAWTGKVDEKKKRAAYDKVFPKWETFFKDDVGYAIDEKH